MDIISIFNWIELHPGIASWVQAFGSVAGIFAAVWIAGSERRHRSKIDLAAKSDLIERAVEAASHSKKVVENLVEFLTCDTVVWKQVPRYTAVIDNASVRISELVRNQSVDSWMYGNLSELASALLDVHGLIRQCVQSIDIDIGYEVSLIKLNVSRIDKVLASLRLAADDSF